MKSTAKQDPSARLVLLIGVFKLVKALALYALGVVALVEGSSAVANALHQLGHGLGFFPGHHLILRASDKLLSLDGRAAHHLEILVLAYGGVFTVEGVGLLSRRRWAEWLTVVVTGSFIPIEIYEAVEHFSAGKLVALALNMAIVAYLIVHRLRDPAARAETTPSENLAGGEVRAHGSGVG